MYGYLCQQGAADVQIIFDGNTSHIDRVLFYWMRTWASYQIRKIAGCACAGNAGNVSPRRQFQRKPLVSDPGMHHGTCATHVPWCMSGSLTCDDGENVPGIPGACAPAILRIWQEAHGTMHTVAINWQCHVVFCLAVVIPSILVDSWTVYPSILQPMFLYDHWVNVMIFPVTVT